MGSAESDSKSQPTERNIDTTNAPTAEALLDLRKRIRARPTAGAIKKSAQEVHMRRSVLSRMIAPYVIERIAHLERRLRE